MDMEIASQLLDEDTWAFVRDALVPSINQQYGVYVQDERTGQWSFNTKLFKEYCEAERASCGRTTRTPASSICGTRPSTPWRQCIRRPRRCASCITPKAKMRKVKLAVGSDGRTRTVLWPFVSKTGALAAESRRVDFFPGGVAEVSDQARARARDCLSSTGAEWSFRSRPRCPTASRCSTSTPPASRISDLPSGSMQPRRTRPRNPTRIFTSVTKSAASARSTACNTSRWRCSSEFRRSRRTRC